MNKKYILILGDVITFALITAIGFISHGESDSSYLPRFFATLIPLLVSWFLLISWFGLLNQEIISQTKNLYLIPMAMILVISFAIATRGFILGSPLQPSFSLAFYATNTIGILVWRLIYIFITKKSNS